MVATLRLTKEESDVDHAGNQHEWLNQSQFELSILARDIRWVAAEEHKQQLRQKPRRGRFPQFHRGNGGYGCLDSLHNTLISSSPSP